MILLIFMCMISAFAETPAEWESILRVVDRHEFYANDELIEKPRGSTEVLFSVVYLSHDARPIKDCVLYRVPGDEPGLLKIKTTALDENCEKYLYTPGDLELKGIKKLQFSVLPETVKVDVTFDAFKTETLVGSIQANPEKKAAKLNMSSAEFKAPSVLFLAKKSFPVKSLALPDQTLCFDVSEECELRSASRCSLCEHGWYETPNGCEQGPRYCGVLSCGGKNQIACRRGMKYQRTAQKYACRGNHSFAYCSKGTTLTCDGAVPFCR